MPCIHFEDDDADADVDTEDDHSLITIQHPPYYLCIKLLESSSCTFFKTINSNNCSDITEEE